MIEALNERDLKDGKNPLDSVNYWKSKIDQLAEESDLNEMMFSDLLTDKTDIKYIIAYSDSKGLKCVSRKMETYNNLIVFKDEKAASSLLRDN